MKQKDHQAERILIGFCVAAYFVSYITRINYGTVLLEIVNSEGITKMSASMAVTGSFVTDRKSTRLNSSHWNKSRMPSSA